MPLTHAQFVRASWPSAEVFAVCSSATHGQDAETRGNATVGVCLCQFFGVSLVCPGLNGHICINLGFFIYVWERISLWREPWDFSLCRRFTCKINDITHCRKEKNPKRKIGPLLFSINSSVNCAIDLAPDEFVLFWQCFILNNPAIVLCSHILGPSWV